jgi:hypothetical protein
MDNRGLSAVLGYVLMLGITTLLISGLFLAAGNFVENQHDRAVRAEFEVVGNRLAADIAAVDRLVLASDGAGQMELEVELPPRVAGKPYQIETSDAGADNVSVITLTTTAGPSESSVDVRVKSSTSLAAGTVDGGDVRIVYDGSQLEVHRA